ncbi:MAG: HNH endonuclease [Anaerolineaceae bacterium]|nr:HNH endonuclease [Anaerolineaceae bacterium]
MEHISTFNANIALKNESSIDADWLERVITSNDFTEPPSRVESKNYRIIRDTLMARKIKRIHNFQCQICHETPIKLKSGFYAEAHHIKPLGEPYNGPDVSANIICVCPNCHVLLDYAAIKIDETKLIERKGHKISKEYIEFHNLNIHLKD